MTSLVDDRLARLRACLATAPFDAVVLTAPESVHYATGYRSVSAQVFPGFPLAAVVTGDTVVLVAPAAETGPAIAGGFPADDIVPFGRFYFTGDGPAAAMSDRHADRDEALAVALRRIGTPGHLGVEGNATAVAGTDATAWMLGVRAVKLPGEQALLRRSAQIAETAIEAAFAMARPGVTERELADRIAATMAAAGGMPRFVVASSGVRSALADSFPTSTPLAEGDLVRLDIGCVYDGYWSDIARTAVLGEPTALQLSRYEALLAGVRAEFDTARPGATAGEVFAAGQGTVEASGLAPYRRHHVGHAIGMAVYERPIIAPGDPTVLVPGMVFSFETPFYELGWGGMMIEDTGVVTETGFTLFTSLDSALRPLPVG